MSFVKRRESVGTGVLAVGADPSKQPKPPERLLDGRDLLWRTRVLLGRDSRRYEAELLFAVQNPRALGHEAVLARDPFLDFLIGDAGLDGLPLAGIARSAPTSSIVVAVAHSALAQVDD
jgi:hypothetical protein